MRALSLLFLPAFAYQALSLFASLNQLRRRRADRERDKSFKPAVSILKPLRGLDPNTFDAFQSQARQDYPEFEMLFGVADASDPAVSEVERLKREFPKLAIRLIVGQVALANGKAGVLANLAKHARYPVWVLNDSDIKVPPGYLAEVVEPLRNSSIGLVTCLYRVGAHTVPALWEALGIAVDFMPSTLVAQLVGVREFGLGSTLAFRADDLRRAGGFEAVGDFLADDYQIAKHITASGKRALLSTLTVETSLSEATWRGSWQHQIRWARTIRASREGGYAGLPITQTGVWIALALGLQAPIAAITLLIIRLTAALVSSLFVLSSVQAARYFWLAPLWDLYSFAVWVTSYAGREVRWRDRVLIIDNRGRIKKA